MQSVSCNCDASYLAAVPPTKQGRRQIIGSFMNHSFFLSEVDHICCLEMKVYSSLLCTKFGLSNYT